MPTPLRTFLIMGCPRSGTTLLAQSLSLHSNIYVPYETDILVPIAFIMHRVKDPMVGKKMITELIINSYYFSFSLGKQLQEEDVREAVEQSQYALHSIFTNLLSRLGSKLNKGIVGDKSPADIYDLLILKQTDLFHESVKIIHLIRDVRDVMFSLHKQNWYTQLDDWFPRKWSEANLFLHTHFHKAPNYFFLRYEDFVSDPVQWLHALVSFLGVQYEEAMLRNADFPEYFKGIPAHDQLFAAIGKQRIGLGKKHLTKEQIKFYELQAHEAMSKFGYLKKKFFWK